jgi:signal peptidase I
LQLPERAKPQFSYSVVLDGKTPIDFEYLLRDMDVTDGIGYKSNQKTLFRALTAKGAARLRNVLVYAVIQEIAKDQNKVFSANQRMEP